MNAGVLTLGTAEQGCALAKELNVRVSAGAKLAVPRANALMGLFLRIDGVDGATGTVRLDADTSCRKLYVRDWPARPDWKTLPRGFYGSSASGAENVRDDLFEGPGILHVVSDSCNDPSIMVLR